MKLSLIICIYNTERHYFDECLSSVFLSLRALSVSKAQNRDFEVCVIDDGSEFDYSDILKKYPLRYLKTENRGIFMARLKGIEMALGEYIAFVDSDDLVSFNYHAPMLFAAEERGLDVVINDWAFKSARSVYFCKNDSTLAENIYAEGGEVIDLFFKKRGREHSYYVLWNKLYRSSVIKRASEIISNHGIAPGYNYSEDVLLNFYVFSIASRVANIHTGYYLYRVHSSQSVAVASEERLKKQIDCMSMTFGFMRSALVDNSRDDLLSDLCSWEALMSRTHYSHARAKGYHDLYPLIREAYGAEVLQESIKSDSASYRHTELLPDNYKSIDGAFADLCNGSRLVYARYDRKSRYINSCISGLGAIGIDVRYKRNSPVIPRPKNTLINRILHNRFIYSLATRIFKKGSPIRAFLKRFI